MLDFCKLTSRFKQFGGVRLVWQYLKLGILPAVVWGFFRCLYKRLSFKAIYPEVLKKIEPFLTERFQVSRFKIQANELTHEHPKVIWWCWLQGIEAAPPIVRACYNSLVQDEWFKVNGYKVNVIDAENWKEYIELPDYIVKKWENKRIPAAVSVRTLGRAIWK